MAVYRGAETGDVFGRLKISKPTLETMVFFLKIRQLSLDTSKFLLKSRTTFLHELIVKSS